MTIAVTARSAAARRARPRATNGPASAVRHPAEGAIRRRGGFPLVEDPPWPPRGGRGLAQDPGPPWRMEPGAVGEGRGARIQVVAVGPGEPEDASRRPLHEQVGD